LTSEQWNNLPEGERKELIKKNGDYAVCPMCEFMLPEKEQEEQTNHLWDEHHVRMPPPLFMQRDLTP
jgi:hypothetical protein